MDYQHIVVSEEDMKTLMIADTVPSNSIMMLHSEDEEVMRFENNGDIYVHGKLVTNDMQVVDGMRLLLSNYGFPMDRQGRGKGHWLWIQDGYHDVEEFYRD